MDRLRIFHLKKYTVLSNYSDLSHFVLDNVPVEQ